VVNYVEEKDSQVRTQLADAEDKARQLKSQIPKSETNQER
jgi:hypothetical protein